MFSNQSERESFPEPFVDSSIDRRKCHLVVPLRLIVLGMPRTELSVRTHHASSAKEILRSHTQTDRYPSPALCMALKHLGFEDTYHMVCLFENPPNIDLWHDAFLAKFKGQGEPFGKADWDQLLGRHQAVADLPTSAFVPELLAAYPDAKLILTPREENSWYDSCQWTIHTVAKSRLVAVRLQRTLLLYNLPD